MWASSCHWSSEELRVLVENFRRIMMFINWCRLNQEPVLGMLKASRQMAPLYGRIAERLHKHRKHCLISVAMVWGEYFFLLNSK